MLNAIKVTPWFSCSRIVASLFVLAVLATSLPVQAQQPPESGASLTPPTLSKDESPESGRSALLQRRGQIAEALQQASAEFGVPLPILQGLAFVQTRWTQVVPLGPTDVPPVYGVMGLRDDDWFGHSLRDAAALIGETSERLKADPVANIRGGAALLARFANEEIQQGNLVDQRLETWLRPVERFTGIPQPELAHDLALDVYRRLRDGLDEPGIQIEPVPDLDFSLLGDVELRQQVLRIPDADSTLALGYPGSSWEGPPGDGNYEVGRRGGPIDIVLVHTIEGTAAGALSWFLNPASNVSAHYIIRADGIIWQVLDDADTGYHAGNFSYNLRAIGIELEGFAGGTDSAWQTPALHIALQNLTAWLVTQYPIPMDRSAFIGHNQVPSPGGSCATADTWGGCSNHYDPGAWFDWTQLMNGIGRIPVYEVLTVDTDCQVIANPEATGPYVSNVWVGQKFVAYDSLNGYKLIYLTGQEAGQPGLPADGEYHWDGWVADSCVTVDPAGGYLVAGGVFPSRLNVRDGTASTSPVLATTIDGKAHVPTGNVQIGYDGNPWYEYDLAWNIMLRRGWSSSALTSVAVSPPSTSAGIGQTRQIVAEVLGTGVFDPAVTWFVDDIPGGSATVGTVTTGGLYAAPVAIPSPAAVVVKAISVQDAAQFGTSTVSIGPLVTVMSTPNPSSVGDSVTFTATVSSGAATPTGTVEFFDSAVSLGSAPLDGAGQGSISTTSLVFGLRAITGTYSGDGAFGGTTSDVLAQMVISPPIVEVSALQTSATVSRGETANYGLQVTQSGTITEAVTLACSGLPEGASCSFSPTSVPAGTASTGVAMTVSTSRNLPKALLVPAIDFPPTLYLALGLLSLCGLTWLASDRSRRRGLIPLLALSALAVALSACGGGRKGPIGTFTITVTGTSSGISGQTTVSLIITQ